MIVTKSWLNEWVNLDGISTEDLCKTFNAIGLEVDRVQNYTVPPKIVIGKVIECESHPDADKLNVCKVDLGTGIRQIVCGASNVAVNQVVAVATIGATMPGGLKIKPVKLRGVDSEGMICSSTELGLPKLNDGIMVLDNSIGTLELGSELCNNIYFNDDLIEIELTANRGDCLSIRGVARDIAAAYNRSLKEFSLNEDNRYIGIGRVLQLSSSEKLHVDVKYRAFELINLELPLLISLRLAQVEESRENEIESLLNYVTYSTGVVLRGYSSDFFNTSPKSTVIIKEDENGYASVYGHEKASTIGIKQEDNSRIKIDEKLAYLEASYIPPHIISKKMYECKIESGTLYHRTSRGSEPSLDLGIAYFITLLEHFSDSKIYGGIIELREKYEERVVTITLEEINSIIGMKIDKTVVNNILQNLRFNIGKSSADRFVISVPRFRHDIVNKQDIVEEIVRVVGIDNIDSKPLEFFENNRQDSDYVTYKKARTLRQRAAYSGFDESVHFVFNEKSKLKEYGFETVSDNMELLNPITATLDTLRSTLMLSLLDSASSNLKFGKKEIRLFELGSVFSSNREESTKLSMIAAGHKEADKISNSGKAGTFDFSSFVQKVSDIIGDFELISAEATHNLAHPYQYAKIVQNGAVVGELFKVHPTVSKDFDLFGSYLCEIDFSALVDEKVEVKSFSKFQASFRDLSVVMPVKMSYDQIKNVITEYKSEEIIRFYPVDRYVDEKLEDNVSLTLRFVLQSLEKTLEEDDITSSMSGVLGALEEKLGLQLR
jgi:phenylalanyl-tRNA synthetase beta chain